MKYLALDGKIFDMITECENYERKLNEEILIHYDFYNGDFEKLDKINPNDDITYIVIRKDDFKIANFIIDLIKTSVVNSDNDYLQVLDDGLPWDYEDIDFRKTVYRYDFYNGEWEDMLLDVEKAMKALKY